MRPTPDPFEVTDLPPKYGIDRRGAAAPSDLCASEPAMPETIPVLRRRAREFAAAHGADEQLLVDIALAVSEAVTNAVKYAYAPTEAGRVSLTGSAGDGWIDLTVSDRGRFREGGEGGLGLGLAIIAEVTTELTVEQADTGTRVGMRFALSE